MAGMWKIMWCIYGVMMIVCMYPVPLPDIHVATMSFPQLNACKTVVCLFGYLSLDFQVKPMCVRILISWKWRFTAFRSVYIPTLASNVLMSWLLMLSWFKISNSSLKFYRNEREGERNMPWTKDHHIHNLEPFNNNYYIIATSSTRVTHSFSASQLLLCYHATK